MSTQIPFNLSVSKDKPYSSRHDACPFCSPKSLTNILETEDDLIWLMNKYPIFEKSWPTVIIETADHNSDIPDYTPEKLHQVISFGVTRWLNLMKRDEFKSVIYFRSHGPHSGGSLVHPHSQIIGLYDTDYSDNIHKENFIGSVFHEDSDSYASLSSYPLTNMAEFNLTLKKDGDINRFADVMRKIILYALNDFPFPVDSYNLFFYLRKHIHVKIFPRHVASPLYLGYKIIPVLNDQCRENILKKLKSPDYFGD